jgi:uncharacterized protein (DUF924 family)
MTAAPASPLPTPTPADRSAIPPDAAGLVAFWRDAGPARWFAKDEAFDARFRDRYLTWHDRAARRELDAWLAHPEGSLALLLLLDQFPRNAFRGTAHMFATDPLARHLAHQALAAGHDQAFEPALRPFFYLPFMHSEDLADQERCVELHAGLGPGKDHHARVHRDVIRRFGRFPHRNPLLGRETTAEQAAFLAEGGFAG